MPTRRPTLLPCRSAGGYALAILMATVYSLLSAATASATDYTWSGGGSSTVWSEGANWLGGVAPTPSESIGTLSLPLLSSFQNLENNLSGLSLNQLTVDESHGYDLTGDALTLGSGGLSLNASEGIAGFETSGSFIIATPLTLSRNQVWNFSGPSTGSGPIVELGDPLTGANAVLSGEHSELTINLNDPTFFVFGYQVVAGGAGPSTANDELGEVTIDGTSHCTSEPLGEVQEIICYKSLVRLDAAALNASDGHPLNLHDVQLENYETATGPIVASDSDLALGGSATGPVTASGSVLMPSEIISLPSLALDRGSKLVQRIAAQGTTPGVDYDQVTSSGTVSLGGATLELAPGGGECPPPIVGQVDTLISTTGNLSGEFGNAPEGGTVTVPPYPCNGEHVYSYRITYHETGSPQTVTATTLPAVPTFGEPPTIAGTATEGQTLSATRGFWTNKPSGYADQWQRCDSSGNNCQAIAGATSQSYTLTAGDVGSTIRVQETASNSEGMSEPAESEATAVVQAASAGGAPSGNLGGGRRLSRSPWKFVVAAG
jgi:hypothetical protein